MKATPPGVLASCLREAAGHMRGLFGSKDNLVCLNYLKPTGYKQAAPFGLQPGHIFSINKYFRIRLYGQIKQAYKGILTRLLSRQRA